jgi:hypothetical protein
MDEADISDARAEIEDRLRAMYRQPTETPQGTGECLWCGELIEGQGRWCDSACRDDFMRHKRQ